MDLVELKRATIKHAVHPWEEARLAFVLRQVKKIRDREDDLSLLEAGCGDAYVVSELAKALPEGRFVGYDPYFEDEVLLGLREQYNHQKNLELVRSMSELPEGIKRLSVVTLLDVIEHIEDEVAALEEIRANPAITPKTDFLITVPAYQELFSAHDVFMKHYRRYDKQLLQERLTAAGFDILEMRYFFFSLLVPRWLQKRLEVEKHGRASEQKGVSAWRGGKLKSALIRNVLILDWRLSEFLNRIGVRLPGLSLFCICRPAVS